MVQHAIFLCGSFLEIRNEISTLLRLLQPREDHLGSRNVLLRVKQVLIQSVLLPDHSLVLVSCGVGVASSGSGLPPKETIQVWTLLVAGALLDGVALRALGLEDFLAGLGVAGGSLRERRHRRRRARAERSEPAEKRRRRTATSGLPFGLAPK